MAESNFRIYVVEDNEWYNKFLVHNLELIPEYHVQGFSNGADVLKAIPKDTPHIVTLDYRLPDMECEKLLKSIKDLNPEIEIIVISEQEDLETAVNLLKIGAFDYLAKSKDLREKLFNSINHIKGGVNLRSTNKRLQKEVENKYQFQNSILGQSDALKKVFPLIEKATQTDITVSISGETGTGKDVVAKAIHYNSARKQKPFVPVNVAAIPAELIETELFGHEKGAFTGAAARRIGKFEEADGGTLFLDEIGEMDINFQAKLLRAVQEKEIYRVGSNSPVKTNCRIIVATNKNLSEEVKQGKFRQDLYYRFFGLPIVLPPLRQRGKDIVLLANHFIDSFCEANNLPSKSLTSDAKTKLMNHSFPGNVRELKSVVELAAVMASDSEITASDITLDTQDALPDLMTQNLSLREYNQKIVNHYMDKFNGNTKQVAEALCIGQTTVYRLLNEQKEPI